MNTRPQPQPDGVLIRAKDVAAMCSVSVRTVERWRAMGIITGHKIVPSRTGAVLFDPAAVRRALTK